MSNLWGKPEKNDVTSEIEEKKWAHLESGEARLRDLKHLEMAYEWLRNRGKTALFQGSVENL